MSAPTQNTEKMTEFLSPSFLLSQFTHSDTATRKGIDNRIEPDSEEAFYLKRLCLTILEPVVSKFGRIHITSGYRSPELNKVLGGAKESYHMKGMAVDFTVPGVSALEVCKFIKLQGLEYDELIHEHGRWIHVACAETAGHPLREELTAYRASQGSSTQYKQGLHNV